MGSTREQHDTPGSDAPDEGDARWPEAIWSAGHQQVVFCHDPPTGLRAIIALYSTALGPGLGGTRFYPYPDAAAALSDVLALAKAMAYKNALAGLDHGGGKAVIIGDPGRDKSEALLRAYGRFVDSLGGRYVTACDVGTYVDDMDVVARETRWVTGRSEAAGGAGDSSVLTAVGVHQGIRAAAQVRWGEPTAAGRLIGISGVGKVGRQLVPLLVADGAEVVVCDVDAAAVAAVRERHPEVRVVADTQRLLAEPLDVFSPCALGGVLTTEVARDLKAAVVCGGANNQLASPDVAGLLADRDVLYCPDFCVNAGGVIQVAEEFRGFSGPSGPSGPSGFSGPSGTSGPFSWDRAATRTRGIFDTTLNVLLEARSRGVTPTTAAEWIAERRMADVGALHRIHLP